MKKKINQIITLLVISIFFNCNQIYGQQNDVLDIKNEKDFVKFINSIAINENKFSEEPGSKQKREDGSYDVKGEMKNFRKTIKINNASQETLTINFSVTSIKGIKFFKGGIAVNYIGKDAFNKPENVREGKSSFNFCVINDNIIGEISYTYGSAPYLKRTKRPKLSGGVQVYSGGEPAFVFGTSYQKKNIYKSVYSIEAIPEYTFIHKPTPSEELAIESMTSSELNEIWPLNSDDSLRIKEIKDKVKIFEISTNISHGDSFDIIDSLKIISLKIISKEYFWKNEQIFE